MEVAVFSTKLPKFDFEVNHSNRPDVAMFDFTSVYQACHAALIREKNGHKLLACMVGDGLYQPFWPQGTGCGRGFISAFNAAWMIRDWALGEKDPLTILAERETLYLTLPMTPGNLSAAHDSYSIDPKSRYKLVQDRVVVKEEEVKHLYNPEEHGKVKRIKREFEDPWESVIANKNMNRRGSQDNNLSDESENSENEGMIPSKEGTLYSSTEYQEVADKYFKDNSERESIKVKKAAMLDGNSAKKNVQWQAGKGQEKNSESESVIPVEEGTKHSDASTEDKEADGEGPEVNSENEMMMMMAKKVMMMNSNITEEDSEPRVAGEKNSKAELIQLKKSVMINGKIVKPEDQCFAGDRSSDNELIMLKEAAMGNFNDETTQDQDVFGESSEENSENASNSPVPEEMIHGSGKDEKIGGTGPVGGSENRSTVGERATVGDDRLAQTMEWNVAKNETMMGNKAAMMMDGSHGNTEDQQLMVDDLLEENSENELMMPGKVVMMNDHVVKTDDQVAVGEEFLVRKIDFSLVYHKVKEAYSECPM
ncbi:putative protein-methionine sulfoxide oxidase mical2b-like [Apostichopus japonicus]|uniref:Uncharacterized protein n=1 Tax=Stichopus japonicus TaxID=307972 RepID=A0A2G8JNU7_STIJA|nr:putative protein-methionine sulfoxide oxidase mical2b-like [Apostichopus japonicus]